MRQKYKEMSYDDEMQKDMEAELYGYTPCPFSASEVPKSYLTSMKPSYPLEHLELVKRIFTAKINSGLNAGEILNQLEKLKWEVNKKWRDSTAYLKLLNQLIEQAKEIQS